MPSSELGKGKCLLNVPGGQNLIVGDNREISVPELCVVEIYA
jgi:hypothetical protein